LLREKRKVHGEHFIPHVVEPSFGVERTLFLTILSAYREKEGRVFAILA